MSFMRWRLPVLSVPILFLLLMLFPGPVRGATGWKLWKGNDLVGIISVREDGRWAFVGARAMAELLELTVSSEKKDTLVISGEGGTLELVRDAAAGRLNGRIRPLASPVECDQGDWWIENRAALRLFGDVMGLTGSGRSLRWAGIQEVAAPESPPEVVSDQEIKDGTVRSPSTEIDRRLAEMARDIGETASSGSGRILPATAPDGVRNIRWGRQQEGPRAVFDLDGPLEPKVFCKPGKTVVIFKASAPRDVGNLDPGNGIHGSIVYYADHVDFTFSHPESMEVRHFALTHPDRYVLDFLLTPEKGDSSTSQAPQEPVPVVSSVQDRQGPSVIVLDPGHGGKDPGAVANGLREKDLNLQIAKRLRDYLKEQGCRVRLTREDDRYLKLSERTALANQWGADVFVSVHINALPAGRHARGVEIYLMALPSDKDAMQLALIENKDLENGDSSGSASLSDRRTRMLLQILGDMQQNAKINESTGLAEAMFTRGRSGGLPMRRVAQAPFYVLRGAGMPSVLLELGFITEKSEAWKLRDSAYQDKLARNLAAGIVQYVNRNP